MPSTESDRNNSYTTNITGSNYGQVHGGSGDMYVHTSATGEQMLTKAELLQALQAFKQEVEATSGKGLTEEVVDGTLIEVERATRELKKPEPDAQRLVERLDNAKKVLAAGAGVATVAAVSADKLIPTIEHIIQAAGKIFNIM